MITVFFGTVALAAIGVAIGYWLAFREAKRAIRKQQEELNGASKVLAGYRENWLKAAGWLERTKEKLAIVTEQRDAALKQLTAQQRWFRNITSESMQAGDLLEKWFSQQDDQPDGQERASAETDEQTGKLPGDDDPYEDEVGDDHDGEEYDRVTEESFRAEVAAAGLRAKCFDFYWEIIGGADHKLIRCYPNKPLGCKFWIPDCTSRLGTVADAIKLSGPPVGTE